MSRVYLILLFIVLMQCGFAADEPTKLQKFLTLAEKTGDEYRDLPDILELSQALVKQKIPADKFIPTYARWLNHALQAKNTNRTRWLMSVDKAWTSLPCEYQKALNTAVRKNFSEEIGPRTSDTSAACRAVCNLVKNSALWANDHFYSSPEGGRNENSWQYATRSLSAFFLEKAKPFCEEAKKKLPDPVLFLKKSGYEPPKKSEEIDVTALKKLAPGNENLNQFLSKIEKTPTEELNDASALYGHQYYSLLTRQTMRLHPERKVELEKKLAEIDSLHRKQLLGSSRRKEDMRRNSFMTTYLFATSALSLPDEDGEVLKKLKTALANTKDPLDLPYSFLEKGDEGCSNRHSAARAVPFHLALYEKTKDADEKKQSEKNLIDSLENYLNHSVSLIAHINRNATHLGADGIAPYYFYPSVPFATAALKILEKKHPEEKEKFQKMSHELESILLFLIERDGLFRPLGTNMDNVPFDGSEIDPSADVASPSSNKGIPLGFSNPYTSSPLYANPLAGLALLPLIDKCNGESVPSSLGVLDADLDLLTSSQPEKLTAPGSDHQ
jgi:hypothetical protein